LVEDDLEDLEAFLLDLPAAAGKNVADLTVLIDLEVCLKKAGALASAARLATAVRRAAKSST
jgi:hypothetical protein